MKLLLIFILSFFLTYASCAQAADSFTDPARNDVLIQSYNSSHDPKYIKEILKNYDDASQSMTSDSIRIALLKGQFGSTLTPKGRQPRTAQAACDKYQCKSDKHDFMQVIVLASGFWAVNSLSKEDKVVQKTLDDYLNENANFKQALIIEQDAFSTYMTGLSLSTVKNDPNVESSLVTYERLGSAKAAFDAFQKAVK